MRPRRRRAAGSRRVAAIKRVVGDQRDALVKRRRRARVHVRRAAHSQAQFGDVENVHAMVRAGYAPLIDARYDEFLEGAVIDGAGRSSRCGSCCRTERCWSRSTRWSKHDADGELAHRRLRDRAVDACSLDGLASRSELGPSASDRACARRLAPPWRQRRARAWRFVTYPPARCAQAAASPLRRLARTLASRRRCAGADRGVGGHGALLRVEIERRAARAQRIVEALMLARASRASPDRSRRAPRIAAPAARAENVVARSASARARPGAGRTARFGHRATRRSCRRSPSTRTAAGLPRMPPRLRLSRRGRRARHRHHVVPDTSAPRPP